MGMILLLLFLQLIYEFQQIIGHPIRNKLEEIGSPFVRNLVVMKEALRLIKEVGVIKLLMVTVFYNPPAQYVVEVTPVSFALATHVTNSLLQSV